MGILVVPTALPFTTVYVGTYALTKASYKFIITYQKNKRKKYVSTYQYLNVFLRRVFEETLVHSYVRLKYTYSYLHNINVAKDKQFISVTTQAVVLIV